MDKYVKNALMIGGAFLAISWLFDFRSVPGVGRLDVLDRGF